MTSVHADQRGIVASWLIKVVLGIAIVGLLFVEGGSIMFTKLSVQDTAESGANAGIGYLAQNPRDCRGAGAAALAAMLDKDDELDRGQTRYLCLPDGRFRVTVNKEASTILVGRISATRDWALVKGKATARPADVNF